MEDQGQPQGLIFEQELRLVWYELEIDGVTNQDELQRWLVSPRENRRQYKSILGFSKGHDGGLLASVGKRSPEYSIRSPFFLAAMGSTYKQGNPNGNQNREGTTFTLGRRRSKNRRLTLLRRSTVRDAFLLLRERGKGQPILLIIRKGVR